MRFFGEVPFQYHEVTSSSGNFTFHQQLSPVTPNTPQFSATGQTSGQVFWYRNGGPINFMEVHLSVGSVTTTVDNEVYVASNGDRLNASFQLHETVNANGVVTVLKVEPTNFQCVRK